MTENKYKLYTIRSSIQGISTDCLQKTPKGIELEKLAVNIRINFYTAQGSL